ncbi:putative metal-binding motif-containing protein [Mesoflavibacter sp. CH_XMU1422-2]|uniref:putative metal-binding motif-containing protein n=1 Tax=Mesoflavibacter sp. CH_XMU1422-2 TaxID=3107770 RepID=UPI00300A1203
MKTILKLSLLFTLVLIVACGNDDDASCVEQTWYQDADADGFGNPAVTQNACTQPTGFVSNNTDCDDSDSGINPGAQDVFDGIDNDCDGDVDECTADSDCDDGDPNTYDYCNNGYCTSVPYCANDNDCPTGTTCVDLGGGLKVCQ